MDASGRRACRWPRKSPTASFSSWSIDGLGYGFLRLQDHHAADEVLELAHVTGPTIARHGSQRITGKLLRRQAFATCLAQEQADKIVDVFGTSHARAGVAAARRSAGRKIFAETGPAGSAREDRGEWPRQCEHWSSSGTRPPTETYSPCCRTRRSRVWASIGMSPISSRNSVPPWACSKRPA